MFVRELIYKEFENEFDKDFFGELTVYLQIRCITFCHNCHILVGHHVWSGEYVGEKIDS